MRITASHGERAQGCTETAAKGLTGRACLGRGCCPVAAFRARSLATATGATTAIATPEAIHANELISRSPAGFTSGLPYRLRREKRCAASQCRNGAPEGAPAEGQRQRGKGHADPVHDG